MNKSFLLIAALAIIAFISGTVLFQKWQTLQPASNKSVSTSPSSSPTPTPIATPNGQTNSDSIFSPINPPFSTKPSINRRFGGEDD